MRLHGLLSRVLATEKPRYEKERTRGNVQPLHHLTMVRTASRPGQRFPQGLVTLSPRPKIRLAAIPGARPLG